jgi:anhydro-N-acetylmuramic acid kinase
VHNYLLSIGVMTGNSLDGVDVVLTRFNKDGTILDLKAHGISSPADLTLGLRQLRKAINEHHGNMKKGIAKFDAQSNGQGTFADIHEKYIHFVARAIKELLALAKQDSTLISEYDLDKIDVIGFHGQTCAHFPPSIAKTADPATVYTCQIGDGQLLADLTGITVVYDFRSDDLMNGGEAAPLAPVHHQHLAEQMKRQGRFPVAFCNAGNTGNFTAISVDIKAGDLLVVGWDTGPFNNYPDALTQRERSEDCDHDGQYGAQGEVNASLLKILFDTAVVTNDGRNFLLQPPPKSSDPQWYRVVPELLGDKPVDGKVLSFEDRLRTAEYFSAYIYVWALTMLPENMQMPNYFALCGGGWKNPISRQHFISLMQGDFKQNPVLPEHLALFDKLKTRLLRTVNGERQNAIAQQVFVDLSDSYGFDGTAMEARIFADAAVCRIKGEPFTKTTTTGARTDTICGIIRFPNSNNANATPELLSWLKEYKSEHKTNDNVIDSRWGRAVAGWYK